ncbi:MAG: SCO family protein [Steroidobacterales bacterium]
MLNGQSIQRWRRSASLGAALASLLFCAGVTRSEDSIDEHAGHRAAAASAIRIEHANYDVPDVVLENERGEPVALGRLLTTDQPVVVNFIFTSCTSICPVMTATMLQLQHKLSGSQPAPRFVSISIDPDFDNAAVLRRYADRYQADWTFLTGKREVVLRVLQAFDAWRGNKGNHVAITLFRRAGGEWTRIEGLSSAGELADLWKQGGR